MIKKRITSFLPRDALHNAVRSRRSMSVCPYCIKKARYITKLFFLSLDAPSFYFWGRTPLQNSKYNTTNGDLQSGLGGKICSFGPICCHVFKTVQDRPHGSLGAVAAANVIAQPETTHRNIQPNWSKFKSTYLPRGVIPSVPWCC